MSLADDFPYLRSYESPAWAEDESEGVDLVSAARVALADALGSVDPSYALPSLVDLRLFGGSVSDGSLSGDLSFVVNRFQREIEAALSPASAENGQGKVELVGISQGSAVLHLKPVYAESIRPDGFGLAPESVFDVAIRKVLDVHDALESGQVAAAIPRNKRLLEAVRMLTEDLVEHEVNLEVSTLEGRGQMRKSTLSQRGIRRAQELFERTTVLDKDILGGYVHAVSLDGKLTLAAGMHKRAKKWVVEEVPAQVIRGGALPLGEFVRVEVEVETKTDHLGNRPESKYRFEAIRAHEAPISE